MPNCKCASRVAKEILRRSKQGKKKYGVTVEKAKLSRKQWLTHLQEELMDACVYIEKLKS